MKVQNSQMFIMRELKLISRDAAKTPDMTLSFVCKKALMSFKPFSTTPPQLPIKKAVPIEKGGKLKSFTDTFILE